jgi:actin-related protein
MEHVLADMMNNDLKCAFDDQKVMMSEPPNNTKENRDRLAEILFEKFEVRAIYFAS